MRQFIQGGSIAKELGIGKAVTGRDFLERFQTPVTLGGASRGVDFGQYRNLNVPKLKQAFGPAPWPLGLRSVLGVHLGGPSTNEGPGQCNAGRPVLGACWRLLILLFLRSGGGVDQIPFLGAAGGLAAVYELRGNGGAGTTAPALTKRRSFRGPRRVVLTSGSF